MFVLPLSRNGALAARNAAVDRFFDESFDRFFGQPRSAPATRTPAMDVTENDEAYTIVLDLPGATREQLDVSVEGRRVAVKAVPAAATVAVEAPADATGQAQDAAEPAVFKSAKRVERVLYRERPAPAFARVVSLPAEVDEVASQAKFDNGVLTLTLTKKVKSGATRLSIA